MIKNIKNIKFNEIRLVEILFYTFPLWFIIGNFAVSLNTLLFIVASLFLIQKKQLALRFNNSCWLLIIFFLYFFISTTIQYQNNINNFNELVEANKEFAFNEKIESWPFEGHPILKSFLLIRFVILILVIDTLFFNKILNFKKLFLVSFLCTSFVSFDIIFQYIVGFDLFGLESFGVHNSGPFGDEMIAGGYLQKLSFLSIFYFIEIAKNKNFNKSLVIFIITLHTTGILLSGNRMPMILFLFGCVLIILFVKNIRLVTTLGLLVFAMLFTVIVTNDVGQGSYKSFHQRYVVEILYNLNIPKLSLKDKEKSIAQNEIEIENEIEIDSTEGYPGKKYYPDVKFTRIDGILTNLNFLRTLGHGRIYRTSIDMWKQQPLFGFGLKSFRVKCWELSHFDGNRACANHAHNYYLELLSEAGLIGVSLIIIFFLILLKNSFYYLIKHNHVINPEKYLFIPLFIIFFLEIWPIRSTGSFFTTGNTFFWLNIALLLSIYKKRSL